MAATSTATAVPVVHTLNAQEPVVPLITAAEQQQQQRQNALVNDVAPLLAAHLNEMHSGRPSTATSPAVAPVLPTGADGYTARVENMAPDGSRMTLTIADMQGMPPGTAIRLTIDTSQIFTTAAAAVTPPATAPTPDQVLQQILDRHITPLLGAQTVPPMAPAPEGIITAAIRTSTGADPHARQIDAFQKIDAALRTTSPATGNVVEVSTTNARDLASDSLRDPTTNMIAATLHRDVFLRHGIELPEHCQVRFEQQGSQFLATISVHGRDLYGITIDPRLMAFATNSTADGSLPSAHFGPPAPPAYKDPAGLTGAALVEHRLLELIVKPLFAKDGTVLAAAAKAYSDAPEGSKETKFVETMRTQLHLGPGAPGPASPHIAGESVISIGAPSPSAEYRAGFLERFKTAKSLNGWNVTAEEHRGKNFDTVTIDRAGGRIEVVIPHGHGYERRVSQELAGILRNSTDQAQLMTNLIRAGFTFGSGTSLAPMVIDKAFTDGLGTHALKIQSTRDLSENNPQRFDMTAVRIASDANLAIHATGRVGLNLARVDGTVHVQNVDVVAIKARDAFGNSGRLSGTIEGTANTVVIEAQVGTGFWGRVAGTIASLGNHPWLGWMDSFVQTTVGMLTRGRSGTIDLRRPGGQEGNVSVVLGIGADGKRIPMKAIVGLRMSNEVAGGFNEIKDFDKTGVRITRGADNRYYADYPSDGAEIEGRRLREAGLSRRDAIIDVAVSRYSRTSTMDPEVVRSSGKMTVSAPVTLNGVEYKTVTIGSRVFKVSDRQIIDDTAKKPVSTAEFFAVAEAAGTRTQERYDNPRPARAA